MKILIGFLLALFISGQAYAQSHAEVLEKGKIIQQVDKEKYLMSTYIVVYKNLAYFCTASPELITCREIAKSNEDVYLPD